MVKPDRPQMDARGKSSRKKHPVKKLEEMDGMEKNVAEALIEPRMGESLPPSFLQGKGTLKRQKKKKICHLFQLTFILRAEAFHSS